MGGKGGGRGRHFGIVALCSRVPLASSSSAMEGKERKCGEWEVGKWELGGEGKLLIVAFEKGDREKRRRFPRSEKAQGKRRENALRGCFLFAAKNTILALLRTFSRKYRAFNSV